MAYMTFMNVWKSRKLKQSSMHGKATARFKLSFAKVLYNIIKIAHLPVVTWRVVSTTTFYGPRRYGCCKEQKINVDTMVNILA
jgi:hypothetical protein